MMLHGPGREVIDLTAGRRRGRSKRFVQLAAEDLAHQRDRIG